LTRDGAAEAVASGQISELFPPSAVGDADGRLSVAGCDLIELAQRFGTPAYIVDEQALTDRAHEYRTTLAAAWSGPTDVMFASKSFPCTPVYRTFAAAGIGCDVASCGELAMALRGGFDPSRILVHGNAKSAEDVRTALDVGVRWVVIDNLCDIDRLEQFAAQRQGVLLRVIPGIDAPTHDAISTGGHDSKFGLSLAEAEVAIARLRRSTYLRLDGIHVHIGSQILETPPFAAAVNAVSTLGEFEVYDLGGGLGARYTYDEHPPSVADYIGELTRAASTSLPTGSTVLVEPGRSLVARAGCTIYEVQTIKRPASPEGHTLVGVNGGMGDNLEVSLYGTRFEATMAARSLGAGTVGERCRLVGHHCESGDCLIDSVRLDSPGVGDIVAMPTTGAYCYTMANNYNASRRPPVVFVRDGDARVVVRRETIDDLMARDV